MSTIDATTTPLGNAIRLARWDRGLSQTLLGERIDVAQSIISAWENGKSMPSVAHLLRLAEALNVDRSAFFDAVAVQEAAR